MGAIDKFIIMSEELSTSLDQNVKEARDVGTSDGTIPSTGSTSGEFATEPAISKTNDPTVSAPTDPADRQSTHPNEEDLIKEMRNFDNLLKMMSLYRDNPDLRGNPNDRNIEEIAKVLANFIGDDPDNFLKDSDDDDDGDNNGLDEQTIDSDEKVSSSDDKELEQS